MPTRNSADGQKAENENLYHLQAAMPEPGSNWSEADACNLKQELNRLLWAYGPRNMTLGDADELAQKLWDAVRVGKLP